jgi:hypothetical protein
LKYKDLEEICLPGAWGFPTEKSVFPATGSFLDNPNSAELNPVNHNRSRILASRLMCDVDHQRLSEARWLHAISVVVALFALLTPRNFPPNFANASESQLSIHAGPHHDNARFNCDPVDTILHSGAAMPVLSPDGVSHTVAISHGIVDLQTKGFHYNRPPPLS